MDPANKDILRVFDFLEVEAHCPSKQADEVIASNLYYVSFPHSLGIISGVADKHQQTEMCEQNNWLLSVIPEAPNIHVINFDRIKEYIPDLQQLKSCDAYFYKPDPGKCFLIEFKATSKDKILKMLDLKTDNADALIKKVVHSKTILENVCFNTEGVPDALVSRTHVVIVYDGKNTEASPLVVRDLLPQKKKHESGGKQMRASFQVKPSRKEIDQPTKRFADYLQKKLGFCSVTKREFPGSAYPDDSPRYASFMTARDFSKAVCALFVDWDWDDYLPYFTAMATPVETTEKVLDPV